MTGGKVYYEKRVIGLPGDTVSLADGVVYVNDEALDEPYVVFNTDPANTMYRDMPEIIVPEGEYLLWATTGITPTTPAVSALLRGRVS